MPSCRTCPISRFSPSGALYIADGGRVRVIGRDGVIRTIAGDGRLPHTIANGTPALSASLGSMTTIDRSGNPLSIAFSPGGRLYIATGLERSINSQLLRLTAADTLATVRATVKAGPFAGKTLNGFGPIALDARGNVDVAGGYGGWAIWQVAPSGTAREIGQGADGQGRRNGGDYSVLETGPGGAVYAEDDSTLLRIDGDRLVPVLSLNINKVRGEYFWLTYFAFASHGTLYADEIPGGRGFEAHQQLVSILSSRVSVLWQQNNAAPR